MKAGSIASLLTVAGAAALARGQIITTPGITARLDLTWQEDPAYAHNDNGVLEPGEHALMLMTVSFTGQNTVVSFSPPAGTWSSGVALGLGSAYFDIRAPSGDAAGLYNGGITAPTSISVGPNANSAGTSGYGVRAGWRVGGSIANGQPVTNGFINIGPGQQPGPGVYNDTNPIANLDRLGWVPNSYSERVMTFSVNAAAGAGQYAVGLYLEYELWWVGGYAYLPLNSINYGSVDIPIVPGPAGLTFLGMGALAAGSRRRRPCSLVEASR